MNLFDIIAMAIHNLWQRRLRTVLNLVGVVIGSIVLLMTSAGASGVSRAFHSLFDGSEFARQIEIYQSWGYKGEEPPADEIVVVGQMSDERRERIKKRMIQTWKREHSQQQQQQAITIETVKGLEAIEHVKAVVPHAYIRARVSLDDAKIQSPQASAARQNVPDERLAAGIVGAGPPSDSLRRGVVFGDVLPEDDRTGATLHEYMAYQLGYRSDEELQQLIGRSISIEHRIEGKVDTLFHVLAGQFQQISPEYLTKQMEFLAAFKQLVADLDRTTLTDDQKTLLREAIDGRTEDRRDNDDVVVTRTFQIRGIYREGGSESLPRVFYQHLLGERNDMQVHRDVAVELRMMEANQDFHRVVVIVESTKHLQSVCDELKAADMNYISALSVIESIDKQITRNSWIVYGVAASILLTAAIGVSNTLFISVMERTPEFGVLKALGAKDRDLLLLMMIEGGVLGVFGAVAAVILSWCLSFSVQILLRMYIENQIAGDITGSLFQFSPMAVLLTLSISIFVCVLASVAPAIRAARLDPVVAMRRT